MDSLKIQDGDITPAITAALVVLFQTHPEPKKLLALWSAISASFPLMALQAGKTDVTTEPNVVLAQALLAAIPGSGIAPPGNQTRSD